MLKFKIISPFTGVCIFLVENKGPLLLCFITALLTFVFCKTNEQNKNDRCSIFLFTAKRHFEISWQFSTHSDKLFLLQILGPKTIALF